MRRETKEQLQQLTRNFYRTHARSFSSSRRNPWPGWNQLLPRSQGRVLDLGCGNGRFHQFIRSAWSFEGEYVGVDQCEALLGEAQHEAGAAARTRWHCADVLKPGDATWLEESFDVVVAWGLLHHIPGSEARLALLLSMAERLSPGGQLGVSFWQFRDHARFSKKELDPSLHGVELDALDKGDALLGWDEDGSTPRYCHHFSDQEVETIAAELTRAFPQLEQVGTASDAQNDRFNAYLIFHHRKDK